jgi:hypothetical protein
MTTVGPNSPASSSDVTNVTGVGDQAWSNPGNAATSNSTHATFTDSSAGSNYLKAVNFSLSIPSGATINGITVEIKRKANLSQSGGGGARITDVTVKLVKGGTISGTNKASATRWTTSEAYFTYGGAADLWGLTLTDSDVNASNFGVVLSVAGNLADGSETGSVDHIRITVDYTAVAGGQKSAVRTFLVKNFNCFEVGRSGGAIG